MLQNNDIETFSAHNDEKLLLHVVMTTLKNKVYKYMTSVWKNVFFDKLPDIVS